MGNILLMSHSFHKGYTSDGDIKNMSNVRNVSMYGSNWETNEDRHGILSNVIATGDIH